jgi:hypothetical protein
MDTANIIKKEKTVLAVNLTLGIVVLAAGALINPFGYQKVLVAISFILFGLSVSSLVKVAKLKKNPSVFIEEFDERIVAAKNNADAMSLRIIRYIMLLVFMAYNFISPQEIFESANWWIILIIFLLTVLLPAVLLGNINKNYRPDHKG